MRFDRSIVSQLAAALLIGLALVACSGGVATSKTQNAIVVTVEPSLVPTVATLPPLGGSPPRIAVVEDDERKRVAFVAGELWLATDDRASLDALLARWNGSVIMERDPADAGLGGPPRQYLVRIDPSEPDDIGALKTSNAAGLGLLATSSREAGGGRGVGVSSSAVGADLETHDVAVRTLVEAASGPTLDSTAYTPDPISWPTHDVGSPQVIGIVEAWHALSAAGRLVLACAAMIWASSDPADSTFPLTGCEVDVAFGTLGSRTLLLRGTDPQGASDSDLATITVLEPDRRAANPDVDRASRGHAPIVRTW